MQFYKTGLYIYFRDVMLLGKSVQRTGCRTLGSRDTNLVSTSALVAYQGKPVFLPPAISPHGTAVDMF